MKTLVVTGYAGMIGYHFTKACLKKGWRVYGIDKKTHVSNDVEEILAGFCKCGKKYGHRYSEDSRSNSSKVCNCPESFTYIHEDICDVKRIPDCDYVVNFAAETHVGNSIIDCKDFIRTNVEGVRNLLDILTRKPKNVRKHPIFLHISTDEVYGDIERGYFDEECPLKPSNPYAASKAAADLLLQSWHRTYGTEHIICRPTNNYGKFQYIEKLIPLSIRLIQEEKKIRLHNGGTPKRNWLNSNDTAEAIITIIEKGSTNEIYNIAGSEEKSNIDTVTKIISYYLGYRGEDPRKHIEDFDKKYFDLSYNRPGQDVRYALNDEKLRALGWEPQRKFDDVIGGIVEHYKNNFRW